MVRHFPFSRWEPQLTQNNEVVHKSQPELWALVSPPEKNESQNDLPLSATVKVKDMLNT